MKLPTPGLCDRCLQYVEDCECCPGCGLADVHEHGCAFKLSAISYQLSARRPVLELVLDDAPVSASSRLSAIDHLFSANEKATLPGLGEQRIERSERADKDERVFHMVLVVDESVSGTESTGRVHVSCQP